MCSTKMLQAPTAVALTTKDNISSESIYTVKYQKNSYFTSIFDNIVNNILEKNEYIF